MVKKSHSSKIVKNLLEKTIRQKQILKKCENFKIQNIEEDRKRFEQSYKERTQYISNLEAKLR